MTIDALRTRLEADDTDGKVTVMENDHDGPKFVRWRAFSGVAVSAPVRSDDMPATTLADDPSGNPGEAPRAAMRRAA